MILAHYLRLSSNWLEKRGSDVAVAAVAGRFGGPFFCVSLTN